MACSNTRAARVGVLQRHHRHADEAIRPRFRQQLDAIVVEVAPTFPLLAVQSIAQAVGVGFQSRQPDLALVHDLDMFLDVEDRRLQAMRLAASERQRPTAFVVGNLHAQRFSMLLGFLDQLLRHVMMMNVDRCVWH